MGKNFDIDPTRFAAYFDRKPFYLQHQLGDHPLFSLRELAALSQRLPPEVVEWNEGHAGAYGRPDAIRPPALGCAETILGIEQRPGWVLLRLVEKDPIYKALLDELLDEIRPLSEPVRPGMWRREGFLFISHRAAVTPFHFDPEHNFLLQLRGSKTVYMWDPEDRLVLPRAAIESYYASLADNRNQPYDDRFLATAWTLPLGAGQGLHFPLHAPHWVRTESDVSISFSITFRSELSRRLSLVHGTNGHLRRLGIEPPPFGASRLWDTAAAVGFRAYEGVKRRLPQESAASGTP
jgi:hypothetical protein